MDPILRAHADQIVSDSIRAVQHNQRRLLLKNTLFRMRMRLPKRRFFFRR